jgi:hypothetical protein
MANASKLMWTRAPRPGVGFHGLRANKAALGRDLKLSAFDLSNRDECGVCSLLGPKPQIGLEFGSLYGFLF